MNQNDSKWFKMMQNDSKWSKMIQNDSKWFKMIQNDSKWFKMNSVLASLEPRSSFSSDTKLNVISYAAVLTAFLNWIAKKVAHYLKVATHFAVHSQFPFCCTWYTFLGVYHLQKTDVKYEG